MKIPVNVMYPVGMAAKSIIHFNAPIKYPAGTAVLQQANQNVPLVLKVVHPVIS